MTNVVRTSSVNIRDEDLLVLLDRPDSFDEEFIPVESNSRVIITAMVNKGRVWVQVQPNPVIQRICEVECIKIQLKKQVNIRDTSRDMVMRSIPSHQKPKLSLLSYQSQNTSSQPSQTTKSGPTAPYSAL